MFSVIENEIFGIASPNGAGESILFSIISDIPYLAGFGEITFNSKIQESVFRDFMCKAYL